MGARPWTELPRIWREPEPDCQREIPVFADLDRAGNQNPDGLDFLTAPERSAEASFEPVVGFDGIDVKLEHPESRLDGGGGNSNRPFVVVFNDDEMTPRWAFGSVASVRGAGSGGAAGLVGALRAAGAQIAETPPGEGGPAGATVRIAPLEDPWHWHFRPSVDADTFEPGSGGGLLERALQSVLGGAIEAAVPGIGRGAVASLTEQVVGTMLQQLLKERGVPVGKPGDGEESAGYGLFGLGQPGLVPVTRIRYWVRAPAANAADRRRVLMRRVDADAPQPVGFVEDLQVRYVTGQNGDVLLDAPPRFAGDMTSAAAPAGSHRACRRCFGPGPIRRDPRRGRRLRGGRGERLPDPDLSAPGGATGDGRRCRTSCLGGTHAAEFAPDRDPENWAICAFCPCRGEGHGLGAMRRSSLWRTAVRRCVPNGSQPFRMPGDGRRPL